MSSRVSSVAARLALVPQAPQAGPGNEEGGLDRSIAGGWAQLA